MSDRGAFDGDAVFMERSFAEAPSAFVAWDSPLGCAVREPGEEAPLPPTAALDIEAIRTQAFADGFEQGCKTVDAEVAAEREALAALTESLQVLQPSSTDALAELLAATVERLVCQIVGEVAINPISLVKRAEAAARLIGEEVDASRLHVHPDDRANRSRSSAMPTSNAARCGSNGGAAGSRTGRRCASSGCAPRSTSWARDELARRPRRRDPRSPRRRRGAAAADRQARRL